MLFLNNFIELSFDAYSSPLKISIFKVHLLDDSLLGNGCIESINIGFVLSLRFHILTNPSKN